MRDDPCRHGEQLDETMNGQAFDALENADRLYAEYAKLAELGDLAFLAQSNSGKREIVASVSPVLCDGYMNAIVE